MKVHAKGHIQLPPRKRPPVNPSGNQKKPEIIPVLEMPLTASVKSIRPLRFIQVRRTPTGRNHAGENLKELLENRVHGLSPPLLMCDALSRNTSEELTVILSNCLTHGRRNFVDVVPVFQKSVNL